MKTFKGYQPISAPEFQLDSPDEKNHLVVKCIPFLPGSRFLDFLTLINGDSPGQMAEALDGIFKAAIVDEQYEAFKAWIEDPVNGVTIEILGEISGYLSEAYSGRPTQPSLESVPS
jgi:hypothetical protein